MNTKNIFKWTKNDTTTYSVEFTEEGKNFLSDMIRYTIDNNSNIKCSEDDAKKFLSNYEKTYEIKCFRQTDELKSVILRVIEAFYVNIIMNIKDTIECVRDNADSLIFIDNEE